MFKKLMVNIMGRPQYVRLKANNLGKWVKTH